MPYVLRVGQRATTTSGDAGALPIEGARASVDGDVLRVLLAFVDPDEPERHAVAHGPVELGVFVDGGIAVLLLRIGRPDGPALIEAKAPVNLLDRTARLNGFLHEHTGVPVTPLGITPSEASESGLTVELALCDSETHVVEALRALHVSADLVGALRKAGRRQLASFACATDVTRATLHATRAATVDELMARAAERYRVDVQ